MDLQCSIKSNWGKTHWAAGYMIQIGLDGIARNVPEEASDELLTNPEVWKTFTGKAPPPKGIIAAIPHQKMPMHGMPLPEFDTGQTLVPQALELLVSRTPEVLAQVATEFGVDVPALGEKSVLTLAQAILAAADIQLTAQLSLILQDLHQPVGSDQMGVVMGPDLTKPLKKKELIEVPDGKQEVPLHDDTPDSKKAIGPFGSHSKTTPVAKFQKQKSKGGKDDDVTTVPPSDEDPFA